MLIAAAAAATGNCHFVGQFSLLYAGMQLSMEIHRVNFYNSVALS